MLKTQTQKRLTVDERSTKLLYIDKTVETRLLIFLFC